MKTKDWIKILTPLTLEVLKYENVVSEEATKAYDAYAERCDQLHNECKEIIDMRLKNFVPGKASYGWQTRNTLTEKSTNAIREASVKYRSVTHALRVELKLDTLPFPLMDCAMFIHVPCNLQKELLEGKQQDFVLMQQSFEAVTKMTNDLQLADDPMVKAIMDSCRHFLVQRGQNQYWNALSEMANAIQAAEKLALESNRSPISVMMQNPKLLKMARDVRLLQSGLSL